MQEMQHRLVYSIERKSLCFMIIKTKENEVCHPAGKILLMNGKELACNPKPAPVQTGQGDPLRLDRTGEFFQMGHSSPKRMDSVKSSPDDWEELFLKEAFFLYENRDRILSDSRMFLTPTPFRHGLAYTGTSGMGSATLGIYIEWWASCERSVRKDESGVYALTYHIAGSPLSGSNCCSAVDRTGRTYAVRFSGPFSEIWSSFMRINQRYAEAKHLYQAYTLEETLAKLREPDEL